VRLARTPFWACGHWSAFARYGRLINRPCLAAPPEAVSAQADTWREAPEEGDFNRLNSPVYKLLPSLMHSPALAAYVSVWFAHCGDRDIFTGVTILGR